MTNLNLDARAVDRLDLGDDSVEDDVRLLARVESDTVDLALHLQGVGLAKKLSTKDCAKDRAGNW